MVHERKATSVGNYMIDEIKIYGARQHNLKNIDLSIPRNQTVVFTGVSGSGKSSLAFHTLFAEGQRRYVESLSTYARQFLNQLDKPDVDKIEGLSPAIAVDQKTLVSNPRSTIATSTEIYDYLRILYATIGIPHDPNTGEVLQIDTQGEMADYVEALEERTKVIVLAPLYKFRDSIEEHLKKLVQLGFVRIRVNNEIFEIEEIKNFKTIGKEVELVVDRLVVREGIRSRLLEALEICLGQGNGEVNLLINPNSEEEKVENFCLQYRNGTTGFKMANLTPKSFSYNTKLGACPVCHGIGYVLLPSEKLIVPDDSVSINEGAIKTWWEKNPKLKKPLENKIQKLADIHGIDLNFSFYKLEENFRNSLFHGREYDDLNWEGLVPQAERLFTTSKSESVKRNVRKFMEEVLCLSCQGKRLKPEMLHVKLATNHGEMINIDEFCDLTAPEAKDLVKSLKIPKKKVSAVTELLREINSRLDFLENIGLSYLTLNRVSKTLSGGEAQRIKLATQIGSVLSGILYVLDEPSIGLHQEDQKKLLESLDDLKSLGNSLVIVEHDEDTIRASDYLVDIGPGAGSDGGEILSAGKTKKVLEDPDSITGQYLSGKKKIEIPKNRKNYKDYSPDDWITIRGAKQHCLKNIDVAFPSGLLTCVTGVSGSGKSTLVNGILRPVISQKLYRSKGKTGKHDQVEGIENIDKLVVVDQTAIGKSPRSNPATYVGVLGEIRKIFAQLPASRMKGYNTGRFSFNVKGGRCEACKGDGVIQIDMHFLNDVYVTCEECLGKRYNSETLEILYKGKTIFDVLNMTVSEAEKFFINLHQIHMKLKALSDVGLGYVKLGQAANTLSGGEAQRIKLACELAKKSTGNTLYLFDEPTTGLHFADIEVLMKVFLRLRDQGNTLIVIEHNLDVIKCADYVVDLGVGGGKEGGDLVGVGTPEEIAQNKKSLTGKWLRSYLD